MILTKNKERVMRVALHSSSGSENYVLHWLGLMQWHVRPPVMSSKYKPFILLWESAVERRLVVNPEASAANPADEPTRGLQQLVPAGVWTDNKQSQQRLQTSFPLWIIMLLLCLPVGQNGYCGGTLQNIPTEYELVPGGFSPRVESWPSC